MTAVISVSGLSKTYVLHLQGGVRLPVLHDARLEVAAGECVALHGPSGAGKSTLLRCLYGNAKPHAGSIRIRHDGAEVELVGAEPRMILELRRHTLGYVSQFLHVVPRVAAIDVVAEPLRLLGAPLETARQRARALLARLNIPERLWPLPPATFSGGEQQRVNIARGFIAERPILLLDEPTASLDDANRAAVIALMNDAKRRGAALVGVFHDADVRAAVADRLYDLQPGTAA